MEGEAHTPTQEDNRTRWQNKEEGILLAMRPEQKRKSFETVEDILGTVMMSIGDNKGLVERNFYNTEQGEMIFVWLDLIFILCHINLSVRLT